VPGIGYLSPQFSLPTSIKVNFEIKP